MNWYLNVLKNNYCNFSGRARREEYWMFVLFNVIFSLAASVIDFILASIIGISFVGTLYSLAVLVPGLALEFRRLHDIDKSAWWLLIALVPVVGAIVLFVFSVLPGTVGDNKYGADPKASNQ